ncbi:hypothetical protein ILYODFUR_000186 [Ilyodon furcidens]|uniref:Uncharacterized protein n=1 Tax=Ilyodon furcidens TaxID=33524 RepID=A0ABV0TG48_9TELE
MKKSNFQTIYGLLDTGSRPMPTGWGCLEAVSKNLYLFHGKQDNLLISTYVWEHWDQESYSMGIFLFNGHEHCSQSKIHQGHGADIHHAAVETDSISIIQF